MEQFIESGMTFGPYAEGHCFRIETSQTYVAIQDNLKIAEFLLYRPVTTENHQVWVVEAKQSSPRPQNQPSFSDFMGEIRDKLSNALAIGMTSIVGRHPLATGELSSTFQNLNLAIIEIRLVLVINGHPTAWLPPLQDALRIVLHDVIKTWALGPTSVIVINHEQALSYGLISSTTTPEREGH